MGKLVDKLILFTICMVSYIQYNSGLYIAVPVICALLASGLLSYFENVIGLIIFIAFSALCIVNPVFLFFLPLIAYDLFLSRWQYSLFLGIIPVGVGFANMPAPVCAFLLLLVAMSFLQKKRNVSLEKLTSEYMELRDTTKEFSMQLENKNKELMEKQDYEVNLATLNERNRIARDIHDNVGHILTNSILQTGALMATCRDEALKEKLNTLKTTLSQGMDSIRESIHDLHDESVDLYAEVSALAENFKFCAISFNYDIDAKPAKGVKYTMLAVIKEALSNVIRHSDATSVEITLREHPALYQLIVKDNGTKAKESNDGIGLKNIAKRVEGLNGNMHISRECGFTLFISIPKEKAV